MTAALTKVLDVINFAGIILMRIVWTLHINVLCNKRQRFVEMVTVFSLMGIFRAL